LIERPGLKVAEQVEMVAYINLGFPHECACTLEHTCVHIYANMHIYTHVLQREMEEGWEGGKEGEIWREGGRETETESEIKICGDALAVKEHVLPFQRT
jgi:hypothetical protein